MTARKKVIRYDDHHDVEIRRKLKKALLTDRQREDINKDLHLLEAALLADCIVVGLDSRLTRCLDVAATVAKKIKRVRFIDPSVISAEKI